MYVVSTVTGNKVTAAAAIRATHPVHLQDNITGGKVTEMPLATTVKNQMLKLLRRSKSTRSTSHPREKDMVIPNKRFSTNGTQRNRFTANPEHSAPNGHPVAMVDPYPMAMGVVSTNGTGRQVPEKKGGSMRIRETRERIRRVRVSTQVRFFWLLPRKWRK